MVPSVSWTAAGWLSLASVPEMAAGPLQAVPLNVSTDSPLPLL